MRVEHYYHVGAFDDHWVEPLQEHLAALAEGRFEGWVRVGIVGPPERRSDVRAALPAGVEIVAEADDGWEQVTLHEIRPTADAVLYAHTKGSFHPTEINRAWRRRMTRLVVRDWRLCASAISEGFDAVGCHWLTHDSYPDLVPTQYRYFGGNFWMASAAYVRGLSPCPTRERGEAEVWIGTRDPCVLDLHPGWPDAVEA